MSTPLSFGCALVTVGLTLTLAPAQEPATRRNTPTITLKPQGEVTLPDLTVRDAAVIDESRIVLVGSTAAPPGTNPDQLIPNGAIVNLATKGQQVFDNGHRASLQSVTVAHGRIATTSYKKDPVLRIWDLKADRTVVQVGLHKLGNLFAKGEEPDCAVAYFHKSERLAIAGDQYVLLLDALRLQDMEYLKTPLLTRRVEDEIVADSWTNGPLAISADDAWVASCAGKDNVVFWRMRTGKAKHVSIVPKAMEGTENWHARGATFARADMLLAWGGGSSDEVPEGAAAAGLPAERRRGGVVQVDMINARVIPLGMGNTICTLHCAADPTGVWLATAGSSRPERPQADGPAFVGELRVYHLPSHSLVYKEQGDLGGLPPCWVAFTPSGKRVIAASGNGAVKWWEVTYP